MNWKKVITLKGESEFAKKAKAEMLWKEYKRLGAEDNWEEAEEVLEEINKINIKN